MALNQPAAVWNFSFWFGHHDFSSGISKAGQQKFRNKISNLFGREIYYTYYLFIEQFFFAVKCRDLSRSFSDAQLTEIGPDLIGRFAGGMKILHPYDRAASQINFFKIFPGDISH